MKIKMEDVKIILADDARTMRKIEINILKSLGYTHIYEADDGLAAKKILQSQKNISLIISDWNMPKMDGLEFLKWVRTKSKKFREIPFIIASAHTDADQEKIANDLNVSAIVSKPFTKDELQEKVTQALSFEKATAPEAEQVSLSKILFDKGVGGGPNPNAKELQELRDKEKILEKKNQKLQDELELLKDTISEHDSIPKKLFKQGVTDLKANHLFEACGNFNAVLALEPENLKALNNLAVIYYEMEMFQEAKSTFEKILKIEPTNEIATENLAELD